MYTVNVQLPLFPINTVAFPEESVHLHVFEPRYRQLIHECDENNLKFGIMPQVRDRVALFGTEMTLDAIKKIHPDGQMDIVVKGTRIFKLKTFYQTFPHRLYPGGDVEFKKNTKKAISDIDTHGELAQYFAKISYILGVEYKFPHLDTPNISFKIAHDIGFSIRQKIQLLSMDTETERQQMILDYFNKIVSMLDSTTNGDVS